MINMSFRHSKCGKCEKYAYYGNPGSKPEYCVTHKEEKMIDVSSTLCKYLGCQTQACFGIKGTTDYQYCSVHKIEGMIDLKNKHCAVKDCGKRPTFGLAGKLPTLCKTHKEKGMIDVANKICEFKNCTTRAAYNLKDCKPRFCEIHKDEKMENVVRRRCVEINCETIPNYNFPSLKPKYCASHRKQGMIKTNKRYCISKNCKNLAEFGSSYPDHCSTHKEHGEYDLVNTILCAKCGFKTFVTDAKMCTICTDYYVKHIQLAKQKFVKSVLDSQFEFKYESYDKIYTSCSKKRPDFVFDAGTHKVILEVDENQHYRYDCDFARMYNITNEIGMPIFWIRYNPDDYKSESKVIPMHKRIPILLEWLKGAILLRPNDEKEFIRVVHLFFDNFNQKNIQIRSYSLEQFIQPTVEFEVKKTIESMLDQIEKSFTTG